MGRKRRRKLTGKKRLAKRSRCHKRKVGCTSQYAFETICLFKHLHFNKKKI